MAENINVHLDVDPESLSPQIPGGRITDASLLLGATDEGKSVVMLTIDTEGGPVQAYTTLALFYAMSRAFTPQWEIEVLA